MVGFFFFLHFDPFVVCTWPPRVTTVSWTVWASTMESINYNIPAALSDCIMAV